MFMLCDDFDRIVVRILLGAKKEIKICAGTLLPNHCGTDERIMMKNK